PAGARDESLADRLAFPTGAHGPGGARELGPTERPRNPQAASRKRLNFWRCPTFRYSVHPFFDEERGHEAGLVVLWDPWRVRGRDDGGRGRVRKQRLGRT